MVSKEQAEGPRADHARQDPRAARHGLSDDRRSPDLEHPPPEVLASPKVVSTGPAIVAILTPLPPKLFVRTGVPPITSPVPLSPSPVNTDNRPARNEVV